MKALKGTKTHDNLKAAFAGESQANRRYLYFASKADVEGHNDVSALFRSTAEGRSEEHTSELQSPDHIVCRLLLEKKHVSSTRSPTAGWNGFATRSSSASDSISSLRKRLPGSLSMTTSAGTSKATASCTSASTSRTGASPT